MTIFNQPRAAAVLVVATLLTVLGACSRPCCPPIPLRDQVVMRGTVDRVAPSAPAVSTSVFLASYTGASALRPHPLDEGAFIWVKPGLDLRAYDHLLIDEVQIVPAPGSDVASFTPELKQRATTRFHSILVETISPYYEIVDAPGDNVLRVRLAITDLVPATDAAEGSVAVKVGAAALEGELVDGRTGERLLAFVDRIEGSDRGEVADAKWRAAEGAFREWADALLDFLDHWEEKIAATN